MGIAKMKSGAHGRGGVGIDGFLYGTGLADLPDLLHLGDFWISEICQMCASQICIGWRKIPEWGQHYLILALQIVTTHAKAGRCTSVRYLSMFSCFGTMPPSLPSLSLYGVLGLVCAVLGSFPHLIFWGVTFFLFSVADAVDCPHCFGHLGSCQFAAKKVCPLISTVASNVAVLTAGTGALSIAAVIKPRFLRIFSRVAFDTILTLAKRKEPGAAFTITATTSATAILTAIQSGQITLEMVLFKLLELAEEATEPGVIQKLKDRMDMLRTVSDIKSKLPSSAFSGLYDTGVLTFMWAKVSEFVMSKGMQVKLHSESPKEDGKATDLNATIQRPDTMEAFAEMMNLFGMYMHGLGICQSIMLSDFFEHAVFDTIRLRGETWQFAHEMMVIMFRRVEDSGGQLTLPNVYNELYLNTVVDEARKNVAAFFRTHAGKAFGAEGTKFNGKFSSTSKRYCSAFNTGKPHTAAMLNPDGTCKFNHVCNHWVKNKGKGGKCLSASHGCHACDNSERCDEPVA